MLSADEDDAARSPTPLPAELIEKRLDRLERKLDRLLQMMESPPRRALVVVPGSDAADMPMDVPVPVASGDIGWRVAAYQVDPADVRIRGRRIGTYRSPAVRYRLDSYRLVGGLPDTPPVGEEREAIFTVLEAGWHRFAVDLGFPARGFGGYLGGFVCQVEIHLDGELLVEQMVRMPYSLGNREKSTSGTAILQSGPHHIGTYVGCVPDGRNNADPATALDAIAVRMMMKRPADRRLRMATAADFFVPATE